MLNERLALTAAVNAERSSTNGEHGEVHAFPKFRRWYNLPFMPTGVDNIKLRLATGKAGNRAGQLCIRSSRRSLKTASSAFVRRRRSGWRDVAPEVTNRPMVAQPQ
jgi:hypothetical protein